MEREVHPTAALSTVLPDALMGGDPLLAPGAVALVGCLILAATIRHPVLEARPTRAEGA